MLKNRLMYDRAGQGHEDQDGPDGDDHSHAEHIGRIGC
jgi:hypothetical protein